MRTHSYEIHLGIIQTSYVDETDRTWYIYIYIYYTRVTLGLAMSLYLIRVVSFSIVVWWKFLKQFIFETRSDKREDKKNSEKKITELPE